MKLSVLDQAPVASGSNAPAALRHSVELAQLSEALGYERYWIAEHHGMEIIATSAPEVLVAVIAQATSRIRVGAGAIILPHYSAFKVAEVFRTLHALFPGRIDLGIGRGPGAGPIETAALVRHRQHHFTLEDFPQQLAELRAFLEGGFPQGHPLGQALVQPLVSGGPQLWLVGATPWGSAGAGALGLPYAFAHFISPQHTQAALASFRAAARENPGTPRPKAILAIGALCAETDEEAQRLALSARAVASRRVATKGYMPSVEEAKQELATASPPAQIPPGVWPRTIVGTPEHIKSSLEAIAKEYEVDEFMLVTSTHDPLARQRSYALLARAFQLPGSNSI